MQKLIELEVEGQPVVLLPGSSMSFEWNNPLFAEEIVPGSFSLPFDLPAAPNGEVFGFPELVANTADVRKEYPCVLRCEGEEIRGLLKLRKVTPARYTVNIQIGYSAFGEALKSTSLRKFWYGGERVMGETLKQVMNHMLDTCKRPADFDYVFAPVENPELYSDKNAQYGGVVNRYVWNSFVAWDPDDGVSNWLDNDGNEVRHHFAYNYSIYSGSTVYSICPFPKLQYVLEQVVKEMGVELQQDFFDEELSNLYILSNATLDRVETVGNLSGFTAHNFYAFKFKMGDLMPDMSFSQLLQALKDTFGLSVQVGLDKVVSIRKLKDMVEQNAYQDLTPYTAPGHEMPVEDVLPVTLTYKLDDSISSERVREFPEDARILDPVQNVNDLQGIFDPPKEHNDFRFVLSVRQWYRYSITEAPYGWGFFCDDYMPLQVAGGGEALEQGIALTLDQDKVFANQFASEDASQNQTQKIPVFGVEGYSRPFGVYHVPQSLRLAFYRGYQPIKEGGAGKIYPMLSGDNLNSQQVTVGEYSLKLDGEAGTYAQFLKSWLELKIAPRVILKNLYMNIVELKKIDFNQKANIDGNRFLIKKLKFTLPITKAVQAELVQVKK